MRPVSCFSAYLVIFYQMPDIANFCAYSFKYFWTLFLVHVKFLGKELDSFSQGLF